MQVPDSMKKAMAWFRHQLPTLNPKDLLPLGIDIQTGAIILGNPSTPNLLVAEFQDALGTFGIATVRFSLRTPYFTPLNHILVEVKI